MEKEIRIAIAGVGNCASSLLQGIEYYKHTQSKNQAGLAFPTVAGYLPQHIKVVCAFDVDARKVGLPLEQAIFAKPNCTTVFWKELPCYNVAVQMGPVLDGVAPHMSHYPESETFKSSQIPPVDVVQELKSARAEILMCYLPVGSEQAVKFYAKACLEAGVAMINCIPVFIASNPEWAQEFKKRGLPLVGDDIKSQFGATLLHRIIARSMTDKGIKIKRTYQLNTGGNTDFLNMLEQSRLKSKKKSKTQSVQSQLDIPLAPENIHIGPSDYVPWQKDNKVCFLRIEAEGFGGVPLNLEARLSVEDSPNSAGVAIDAIRFVKVALDRNISGPLIEASAFTMKSPPVQMRDSEAFKATQEFVNAPGENRTHEAVIFLSENAT